MNAWAAFGAGVLVGGLCVAVGIVLVIVIGTGRDQ